MKVVLFCGGQGLRIRDYSETIPKPMVPIGQQPILWHLMKYYAHFGHKDFILCLGWKGNVIREYFLNHNECLTTDFKLRTGLKKVELLNHDIDDWTITFVDTGQNANIGQRLKAVEKYLEGEEVFLANYSDVLTDVNLPDLVEFARRQRATATFLCVRTRQSLHKVDLGLDGRVSRIESMDRSDIWINGGFFVMRREIFDYIGDGEELVVEPFSRLIAEGRLSAMKYEGFWGPMDTYKDKMLLDDIYARGEAPWVVWGRQSPAPERSPLHERLSS
jgi:glucose-1-phosphate cytidylyltransferase